MNSKLISKLKCKRGVSIIIALIIFLLCALAGASAFMMASSNVGRYSHPSEQEYYSVSSAALLVVDLLDGLTYTSKQVTFTYTKEWDYTEETQHNTTESYDLVLPAASSSLDTSRLKGVDDKSKKFLTDLNVCQKIQAQCDALVPVLYVPPEWYARVADTVTKPTASATSCSFNITVKDSERFGTVKCKMVMNENFNLMFTLQGEDGAYSMTIYWVAEVTPAVKSTDPKIEYTSKDSAGNYTHGVQNQISTLTVTAQWNKDKVTISRGEAVPV